MYYNENIWLDKSKPKNKYVYKQFKDYGLKLAGSPNATNITMESFHQNTNCFSCYSTTNYSVRDDDVQYQTLLNVSHIYTGYFAKQYGLKKNPDSSAAANKAQSEVNKFLNERKLEASFK